MKRFILVFGTLVAILLAFQMVLEAAEIKVGGFGQIQYYYDEASSGASKFIAKRARLRALATLTDRVGFFTQLDFIGGPALATTLNTPILNDARLDVTLCPYSKLSAGQFCIPFGIETPISPYNLEAINYSYVVTNLTGYLRDVGVMLSGKYSWPDYFFDYSLALVNGTGYNKAEDNKYKDLVGRLGFNYKGFGLGASLYTGKKGAKADLDKMRTGVDAKFDKGPFFFQAEYIQAKDDTSKTSDDISSQGYYLLAGYKILSYLQPMVKFDLWDPNTDTKNNQVTKIALGGNWLFSPAAKLQLFYDIKGEEKEPEVKNNCFTAQLAMTF